MKGREGGKILNEVMKVIFRSLFFTHFGKEICPHRGIHPSGEKRRKKKGGIGRKNRVNSIGRKLNMKLKTF